MSDIKIAKTLQEAFDMGSAFYASDLIRNKLVPLNYRISKNIRAVIPMSHAQQEKMEKVVFQAIQQFMESIGLNELPSVPKDILDEFGIKK